MVDKFTNVSLARIKAALNQPTQQVSKRLNILPYASRLHIHSAFPAARSSKDNRH